MTAHDRYALVARQAVVALQHFIIFLATFQAHVLGVDEDAFPIVDSQQLLEHFPSQGRNAIVQALFLVHSLVNASLQASGMPAKLIVEVMCQIDKQRCCFPRLDCANVLEQLLFRCSGLSFD